VSGDRELALLSVIAGGEASQRDLSRRVGLSLGGTNERLRTLIRRGLVRARAVDGRAQRYELTARGACERRRLVHASAKRVVLDLLAGPDLPPSARQPASRLIKALTASAIPSAAL